MEWCCLMWCDPCMTTRIELVGGSGWGIEPSLRSELTVVLFNVV